MYFEPEWLKIRDLRDWDNLELFMFFYGVLLWIGLCQVLGFTRICFSG